MSGFPYEDILKFPYPNPEIEKDFPDKVLRAAQFAPFAALTGHDAAVAETARITQRRQELDEDTKAQLDVRIRMLDDAMGEHRLVSVTYFVPDERKEGGCYRTYTGVVVSIKSYERQITFADGTEIPIDRVVALEGELFEAFLEENEDYENLQDYCDADGRI